MELIVKFGFIPVIDQKFKLCDLVKPACPVPIGPSDVIFSENIPGAAPSVSQYSLWCNQNADVYNTIAFMYRVWG